VLRRNLLHNVSIKELEAIAGLAALENRKVAQIELIVRVARSWTDEQAQAWLLELARSAYGLCAAPQKLERHDPVEVELIGLLNLLAFGSVSMMTLGRGLVINSDTWIAMISSSLSSLEEARRTNGSQSKSSGSQSKSSGSQSKSSSSQSKSSGSQSKSSSSHPVEAALLEVIEFVKQEFFGKALNIAERSALRGLYERQKNLLAGV
jgi:hypothetical protein